MGRSLIGPGPAGLAGPVSNTWTTPFPHALGDRAKDNRGNEYLFVQCITAVQGEGTLVSIDHAHNVAPLLHTSGLNTRVGIAQTSMTAGQAGWVQIYGVAFVQGNNMAANAVGVGSSTDATSIGVLSSTSEIDAFGAMVPIPQLVVTSPSGTLNFAQRYGDATGDNSANSSLTSVSSNSNIDALNYIQGMTVLTQAQVSALPDAYFTERYPTVTSPVSAVSATSGPVTLTSYVSGTVGGHIGGEWVVFLNYPILSGNLTS